MGTATSTWWVLKIKILVCAVSKNTKQNTIIAADYILGWRGRILHICKQKGWLYRLIRAYWLFIVHLQSGFMIHALERYSTGKDIAYFLSAVIFIFAECAQIYQSKIYAWQKTRREAYRVLRHIWPQYAPSTLCRFLPNLQYPVCRFEMQMISRVVII